MSERACWPALLPLALISTVHAAVGQNSGGGEAWQACRQIADATQRLACYDALPASGAGSGAAVLPVAGGANAGPARGASGAPAAGGVSSAQVAANTGGSNGAAVETAAPRFPVNAPANVPASVPIRVAPEGLRAAGAAIPSLLGKAWELDPEYRGQVLQIRQYKPVYALPWFSASRANRHPNTPAPGHSLPEALPIESGEAKFQISLKAKLAEDLLGSNGDLWFGYTQSSRWQVYNGGVSRPFRETNYEPEAMLVWRTDYDLLGWRGRLFSLGINHQSNGRALPLSRSWNRVIATAALEKGDWTLALRPWWRVREASSQDDNPDIANYLGRGDLQLIRRFGGHQLSLMLRHSLRGGEQSRGAVQIDYAFPIEGSLRGHLQWFSGYGESLIDYNHRATYYGVGLSLLEWY
ncbi:phospholipase A [Dechloromonas sp. ZY10]|uniref:phospholipase A n=1 Tax=Dechloromonas aquae TaxID=2664436 RepID=UPI00352861DD